MNFNGIDMSPYLRVRSIEGRGPLKREVTFTSLSGVDGAYFQRVRKPIRPLKVSIDIRGSDEYELRKNMDTLNGVLNVEAPVPIIFDDENDRTYYGIPEGSEDGDEYTFLSKSAITILCLDPDKYGQTKTVSITGTQIVNYAGTEKASPTIDVTFTAASSEFIISNDGKELRIIYDFVIGSTLNIDFEKWKVTIDGVLNMPTVDINNPNFFKLKPGVNNLSISPSGETVTLTYSEVFV